MYWIWRARSSHFHFRLCLQGGRNVTVTYGANKELIQLNSLVATTMGLRQCNWNIGDLFYSLWGSGVFGFVLHNDKTWKLLLRTVILHYIRCPYITRLWIVTSALRITAGKLSGVKNVNEHNNISRKYKPASASLLLHHFRVIIIIEN